MGIYLKIGETDVSRFITENEYSVSTVPIFDEDSEFVNIYGERIRERTGMEVTVSAVLCDVDDSTAGSLSAAFSSGSASVTYSAPDERTAVSEMLKLSLALDRVYKGEKFWTVELLLHGYISEESL